MSSGRDKRIWVTDLRNPEQRVLLCEASAPVLRLCLSQDMDHVWVATEESSIKRYVSAYQTMALNLKIFFYLLFFYYQPLNNRNLMGSETSLGTESVRTSSFNSSSGGSPAAVPP